MKRSGRTAKSPAFQFYPGDFLSDSRTAALSMAERGVFLTLLAYQWMNGPLPDSTARLARLCQMPPADFEVVWPMVSECFPVDATGNRASRRLERERDVQAENRAERKARMDAINEQKARDARNVSRVDDRVDDRTPPSPVSLLPSPVSRTPGISSSAASPAGAPQTADLGFVDPPPKPKRKAPKVDPDAKRTPRTDPQGLILAHFEAAYESLCGQRYAFDGGKDGAHLSAIYSLARDDMGLARRVVDALFADPHWQREGLSLGIVRSQFSRYVAKANAKPTAPANPRAAGAMAAILKFKQGDTSDPYAKLNAPLAGGGS